MVQLTNQSPQPVFDYMMEVSHTFYDFSLCNSHVFRAPVRGNLAIYYVNDGKLIMPVFDCMMEGVRAKSLVKEYTDEKNSLVSTLDTTW